MSLLPINLETAARDRSVARVRSALQRAGATTVEATVDERTTRANGVTWRGLTLAFVDGQVARLKVRAQDGSLAGAELGGESLPIDVTDTDAAVADVAARVAANAGRFRAERLEALGALAPPAPMATSWEAQEKALTAQLAGIEDRIDDADAELARLRAPATA